MPYYAPDDESWSAVADPPADPPHIAVDGDGITVRFVGPSDSFCLEGAPVRTASETIHTVALVAPSLNEGLVLCALRAEGQDLTVEDRRPGEARGRYAEAFDQLQSALDEILVPVYIDDALEEVSESVDALVAVHTAQYAAPPTDDNTYFRTSVFQAGSLLLEEEQGAL